MPDFENTETDPPKLIKGQVLSYRIPISFSRPTNLPTILGYFGNFLAPTGAHGVTISVRSFGPILSEALNLHLLVCLRFFKLSLQIS